MSESRALIVDPRVQGRRHPSFLESFIRQGCSSCRFKAIKDVLKSDCAIKRLNDKNDNGPKPQAKNGGSACVRYLPKYQFGD